MSAIISECGLYRYRLEREIQADGIIAAFFGVNPSTADANAEDATTRKWRGFSLRNGIRRYIVGNPFALRATDVNELRRSPNPMGPENNRHLTEIIAEADLLIPCWGDRKKLPKELWANLNHLSAWIRLSGKPVKIFGLTKGGDPLHPLMLGYNTPLIPWRWQPAPHTGPGEGDEL